jgi:hypothetical protein
MKPDQNPTLTRPRVLTRKLGMSRVALGMGCVAVFSFVGSNSSPRPVNSSPSANPNAVQPPSPPGTALTNGQQFAGDLRAGLSLDAARINAGREKSRV